MARLVSVIPPARRKRRGAGRSRALPRPGPAHLPSQRAAARATAAPPPMKIPPPRRTRSARPAPAPRSAAPQTWSFRFPPCRIVAAPNRRTPRLSPNATTGTPAPAFDSAIPPNAQVARSQAVLYTQASTKRIGSLLAHDLPSSLLGIRYLHRCRCFPHLVVHLPAAT